MILRWYKEYIGERFPNEIEKTIGHRNTEGNEILTSVI